MGGTVDDHRMQQVREKRGRCMLEMEIEHVDRAVDVAGPRTPDSPGSARRNESSPTDRAAGRVGGLPEPGRHRDSRHTVTAHERERHRVQGGDR